jgi:hypothetical protein
MTDISKYSNDPLHKGMLSQRKEANAKIVEAFKKGADISQIGEMRLKQNRMERGQHNILHERASKDPYYKDQQKNK